MKTILLLLVFTSVGFAQSKEKYFQKQDKFNGERLYYSVNLNLSIQMIEKKDGEKTNILSFSTSHKILVSNPKGLYILFDDGTKLEFPEMEIETRAHTSFIYTAHVQADEEFIEMITSKLITDLKIAGIDQPIGSGQAKNFQKACVALLK